MKTLPRHSELAKALVYWRYEWNDEAACQSQGAFGTKSTERPPALELSCTVPVLASHTRNNLTANCAREQPLQPLHWICSPGIFRRCLLPFSISAVYPSTSEPHNLRHTSHKTTFSFHHIIRNRHALQMQTTGLFLYHVRPGASQEDFLSDSHLVMLKSRRLSVIAPLKC